MKRLTIGLAAIGIAAAGQSALAEGPLGAHEHGHGALNIAVENGGVLVELTAPGADIVGFEHPAETAADKAAIQAARKDLAAGDKLFLFSAAAGCVLQAADIDGPEADDDDHDHADRYGHAHAEDKHDGDKHAHDKHADDKHVEESHSEFRAVYRFACAGDAAPAGIQTRYFERFSGARELEVQAIWPTGQGAGELTPDVVEFSFR